VYILQKPTTCPYSENSCRTAAKNGGISPFPETRTKLDVLIHHIESELVVNISEDRVAAMYIESKVH
jgi:hypothetical protein